MRKKILVVGPMLSRSGYGEQTRFALRALRTKEAYLEIFLENIAWGKTGHIAEDTEFRRWMDTQLLRTAIYKQQNRPFDISLQVTIPNEWNRLAPVNIGYTAGIETTKVAPVWLANGNDMDKIIVVSNHSKHVYETTTAATAEAEEVNTGKKTPNYACTTPIEVVNYAVRHVDPEPIKGLELDYDFNLLTVAQWGPRKNLTNTIKWFVEEFKEEEVGLVIKTNLMKDSMFDRELTAHSLRGLLQPHADRKCKVYLLHGSLSDGNMAYLYQHKKIKGMVSLSHGEGFGLPLFEAASCGLPLITTNWSGQSDFINMPNKKGRVRPHVCNVKYHLQPVQKEAVWPGVVQKDSMWAFPIESSAKDAMRNLYKNYPRCKSTAKRLEKWINKNFSEEQLYQEFVDLIYKQDPAETEWLEKLSMMESL